MAEPGAVARVDRGRPRNPGKDAAILDAALDLFIERGAAGASIEAIARQAGVAKLTVYRRWQSKEDLLMAALEHSRAPEAEDAPQATTIDDLVDRTADLLSSPRFRALVARVIGASVDQPELIQAYTKRHLEPRLAAITAIARQSIAAGQFAPDTDPTAIQDAITSAMAFVLLQPGELTAAEIKQRLQTLLNHIGYQRSETSTSTEY
ncbi:TetR/AcrR family transcriptional regulator [Kribbella sp. NBC_01505]|uniref:TetR/AcrR family transcriptional regulator n=1 Tax=Kribbella sp. NBC_01505 TaxID=2903580 RepID=UPI00386DBE1B